MNPESNTASTVTLVLETGQKFEEVPVRSSDSSLEEFLDQVLKDLEVCCLYLDLSIALRSKSTIKMNESLYLNPCQLRLMTAEP